MKAYFPHDSNARTDERLLELRAEHGWAGYGLWWALVEQLRDATDYRLSNAKIGGLAMGLAMPAAELRQLLDCCIGLGLLATEEDGAYFYAPALRTRMAPLDAKRAAFSEAGKRGASRRWAGDKPTDTPDEATPTQEDSLVNSHPIATPLAGPMAIRVDKSKEEDTTPLRSVGRGAKQEPEHFAAFWQAYPRKEARAVALKAFTKLSPEDQAAAAARAREWFGRRPPHEWMKPDGTDVRPHPATWLNQQRWTDLTEVTITTPQQPYQHHGNPQRNAVHPGLVNHEKRGAAFTMLKELGL